MVARRELHLFCRLNVSMDGPAARSIWLMHEDGSEARQVAGPLEYPSDLWKGDKLVYYGYYGYTDWLSLLDWWQGLKGLLPASVLRQIQRD